MQDDKASVTDVHSLEARFTGNKCFSIAANVTDDVVVMERCNNYIFENDHFGFWFEGYQFGVAICNATREPYMRQWMVSNTAWEAIVVPHDGGWIVEAS